MYEIFWARGNTARRQKMYEIFWVGGNTARRQKIMKFSKCILTIFYKTELNT
jgi:hypothetical protein